MFSVQGMQNKDLSQALKTVLTQQTMAMFGNKTAQALNEEFLSCHGNSLPHIHAGKTLFKIQLSFLHRLTIAKLHFC